MANEIVFENLTKGDAKKLQSWWNANTKDYYFIEQSGKNYKLIRQVTKPK